MTDPPLLEAHAAYQRFLPDAQAIASEDIIPYRLDPDLVIANVRTAMQVIAAYRSQIPKHLPRVDLHALEALPALAVALKFAAIEADRAVPTERIVSEALVEARQIRGVLLPIVAGLVATGVVPAHMYEDIVRGRGPRYIAQDCLTLSSVFTTHKEAVKDKHSADPGVIDRAAVVGSFLLEHLRPAGSAAAKSPPYPPLIDLRNRFATVLTERYRKLQIVAHYFCGDDYERVAPPLMSQRSSRSGRSAPPSPASPAAP
jgi:hypothetical protein